MCICSDAARGLSGNVFEVWGERIVLVAPPKRGASIARAGDEWSFEKLAERSEEDTPPPAEAES